MSGDGNWMVLPGYGDDMGDGYGARHDPSCDALRAKRKEAIRQMWKQRIFTHQRRQFELLANELKKKVQACELHAKRTASLPAKPHPKHPLPLALRPRPAAIPPAHPALRRLPPRKPHAFQPPPPPPGRFRPSVPSVDASSAVEEAPTQMDTATPAEAAEALGAAEAPWWQNPLVLLGGAAGAFVLWKMSKKGKKGSSVSAAA